MPKKAPQLSSYGRRDQWTNGSPRVRTFERIRESIFSGKFLPGDSLKEMHLARELGVSQATVREALIRLEHTGLVVRIPNSETRVTNLSSKELKDRLTVRAALEEIACVEALKTIDEDFFDGIERRLEAIAEAASRGNAFELSEQDFEFHRFIWRWADNQVLYQTLDQICPTLFASVGLLRSRGNPQKLETAVRQHESVIHAFRSRDEQKVRENIRHHVFAFQGQFFGIRMSDSLEHALRTSRRRSTGKAKVRRS